MFCVTSKNDAVISDKDWFVRFDAPLKILLTARFFAAFLVHISDCDETFNYWEPVNLLLNDNIALDLFI
jgi:alpha-1,2-mannosyltransferase